MTVNGDVKGKRAIIVDDEWTRRAPVEKSARSSEGVTEIACTHGAERPAVDIGPELCAGRPDRLGRCPAQGCQFTTLSVAPLIGERSSIHRASRSAPSRARS